MITGAHAIIYSTNPEADRTFVPAYCEGGVALREPEGACCGKAGGAPTMPSGSAFARIR